MKQTAVEWLVEELTLPEYGDNPKWVKEVITKAKEMEKQQIIDSYNEGDFSVVKDANYYYDETFNKNK